jgi:phosphoglycolate phosphatase-like HAD superfamily hydrolase
MPIRLVWLFDVDGTLIRTDGAAREAMSAVVLRQLGIDDDLREIPFAGRTDPGILTDILTKHARTLDDEARRRFWSATFEEMESRLAPGRGTVLPGVTALLDAIADEPSWRSALLTGNTTGMARIKLGHFGLHERFVFGAFGEEAVDRNALACVAVARAAERFGVLASSCIVVGDTEHDIACARAAGARAVAVATGMRTREQLEPHRPDLLLDSLAEPESLLAWARAIAAGD